MGKESLIVKEREARRIHRFSTYLLENEGSDATLRKVFSCSCGLDFRVERARVYHKIKSSCKDNQ